MRILFALFFLLYMVEGIQSQHVQVEFLPATDIHLAHVNYYSEAEGIEQYYLEDAKWVKNSYIPSFEETDKFKNINLQYIAGNDVNPPQLFVYSQTTGDFSFYFLHDNAWLFNNNLPSGKIKMNSKNIVAQYTQADIGTSAYVFSYSLEDSQIQLLGINENGWVPISNFPDSIPQK